MNGVLLQSNSDPGIMRGVTLANNRIDGTPTGIHVALACANTVVGNNLQKVTDVGAVFEATTGANVFRGNGKLVRDEGAMDCDGDGLVDPNSVTGAR